MFSSCEKIQQLLPPPASIDENWGALNKEHSKGTAIESCKQKKFQQRRVNLGLILSKLVLSSVPFHIGQFIYFSGITNCDVEQIERNLVCWAPSIENFNFPFWHFVVLGFFPKWELVDNQAFSNLRNSFKSKPDDRAFSMSSFTTLHPIAKLSFLQV